MSAADAVADRARSAAARNRAATSRGHWPRAARGLAIVAGSLLAACTVEDSDDNSASDMTAAATNVGESGPSTPDASVAGTDAQPDAAPDELDPAAVPDADTLPGVTDDSITIGIGYTPDANRLAGETGVNVSVADGRATAEAAAQYINSEGGVAGRELQLAFHEYTAAQGEVSDAVRMQAACDSYTDDDEVYAVFQQSTSESLLSCLEDRDTLLVGSAPLPGDQTVFDRYEGLFSPESMPLDDQVRTLLTGLEQSDFWDTNEVVVGVLRLERPDVNRVAERVLKPMLAKAGYEIAVEVTVPFPERLSEIADLSQAAQAAVLRMKEEGVTHLIFLDEAGGLPSYFMYNAESQGYRARYAFTTSSTPTFVVNNTPAEQLAGVYGTGWAPLVDVGAAAAADHATETTRRCQQIYGDAGIEFDSDFAEASAIGSCGDLLWFKAVGDAASSFDHADFRQAVAELDDTWTPASTFSTAFSADDRAGAAGARLIQFDELCGCLAYGDLIPVG